VTRLSALSLLLLASPAAAAEPCDAERTAAMRAEHDEAAYAAALAPWGLCEEKAGHFADAHRLVSRALEGAPAETTPAGRAARWTVLYAARRRLDDRVARVLVTWEDGAELYVDGKPAGGVSGRVMAVDPGRRLFEARKAGKTIAAQEVEARAGDLPAVTLKAPLAAPIPAEKPRLNAPQSGPEKSPSAAPISSPLVPSLTPRGIAVGTAYAAGGFGLVAGVVAGILEAQRVSLRSGLTTDACPTPDASPRCAQLRQVFEQSRGARNVALVAAGVAVAAGGVAIGLHFTSDRVAPTSAGVTVGGSW
jgi:hypothetical protein